MLLARQLFIKCFSFFLLAYLLLDKKTTMVGAVRVILNSISSISKNRTLVTAPSEYRYRRTVSRIYYEYQSNRLVNYALFLSGRRES